MIPPSDARAVLSALPVADVARVAWRAATPDRDAAVVLDAGTGALRVLTWPPGSVPDVPDGAVVLAYAPAARHASITRALAQGIEVPPSAEIVEEYVARLVAEAFEADGLAIARAVEERLTKTLSRGERGAA